VRLAKLLWYDGEKPLEQPLPTPKQKLSMLWNGDESVLNTDLFYKLISVCDSINQELCQMLFFLILADSIDILAQKYKNCNTFCHTAKLFQQCAITKLKT
ncbi:MAG: hypothetical protein IIX59_08775, partial [Alistipes sp.]|nr:hypothetical protein [Alistipes sp.]